MLRVLMIGVLAFWLVMSVLLVRVVYFPDGTGFGKVPPELVLKMFLEQGTTLNTLHVYHKERKLGFASISQRRTGAKDKERSGDFVIFASGGMDKGAFAQVPGEVAWRVDFTVEALSKWKGSKGQVRIPESRMVLDFDWKSGQALPQFSLKQHGLVIADEKVVAPLVTQVLGSPGAQTGLAAQAGEEDAGLVKVTAREGTMTFAGQMRRGYVVEFSVMERWKARAFVTEAGELAVVDLPEGYRLVEPIIHGLAPEYDEEVDG